jgi:hypothetical protein
VGGRRGLGTVLLAVALSVIVGTGGHGPVDPYWLGGLVLTLSISATMCIWQSRLQHEVRLELVRILRADPLHHRADERLYEAKRQSPSSVRRRITNSRSSSSTASSMGGLS